MVPKSIGNVIRKFKSALKSAEFPPFRIVVFGSYARGDARKDSDIDLCLVSRFFKGKEEKFRRKATLVAFDLDPRIQVVAATPERLKDALSPLFSYVRKEGIVA